ncbi:MAG: TGS domain-containing protein [Bacteroidetes bacterium]|nr:TGS domain-containing protein [Bacteroidota bacterium]
MSASITLTFPDGSTRSYQSGVTGHEVASSISEGLARVAVSIGVDGETRDLARPIEQDANIQIFTLRDDEGWATYWHSSAHLMAEALQELYPGVKFGIGPAIDKGFYYDVDLGDRQLTADDLEAIEKKMMELAKRDTAFERREVSKEEAVAYFTEKGDEYKLELLEDLEDGTISFYTQGDFTDLCRGPHIPSTKPIKYAKLLNIAGAYWRGDQDRKQLTRLYGITFPKKGELDDFLEKLELARQRDHRKLGKELELFHFSRKVGSGLPLWLPKGTMLRETLVDFLKNEQLRRGYQPVITPHIGRLELYKTSGHYPYYSDSQFPPMMDDEEEGYLLKPMNCPHHTQVYDAKPHSYRDLPVRLAEFGTVYRREAAAEKGLDTIEIEGEAAFYGPKLDFMVKDALGREWQLGTIQIDYNLPQRFDLWFTGSDDQKHRPVMIHRAPFGSLERFIGVLIEHCGGNFPTWLAPVQVQVLPVGQSFIDYAEQVTERLREAGFRAEADLRHEKVGYKIRSAEVAKTPYMLIVGQQEMDADSVSVRRHGEGDKGSMAVDAYIAQLRAEVKAAFQQGGDQPVA